MTSDSTLTRCVDDHATYVRHTSKNGKACVVVGDITKIELGYGLYTICDTEIIDTPIQYHHASGYLLEVVIAKTSWCTVAKEFARRKQPMARASITRSIDGVKKVFCCPLHRLVVAAKPGETVDHINRNPLDNRRENLRIVSMSDNAVNRTAARRVQKYRGVYKGSPNSFRVSVGIFGTNYCIGNTPLTVSDETASRIEELAHKRRLAIQGRSISPAVADQSKLLPPKVIPIDWDTLFNGETHELRRGVHFKSKSKDFRSMAYNTATKRGLKVKVSISGDCLSLRAIEMHQEHKS